MADRLNFYFRQKVTEAELDLAFQLLEQADRNLATDIGLAGIITGAVPAQHDPVANLTIDLTSPAKAYDQLGQRVTYGTDQVVDCSVDLEGIPTTVTQDGNERWLGVFLRFKRQLSDPRTDGNSQQVYFRQDESFEIVVRQGPEATAGNAPKITLQAEELLLCDVKLAFGQTQITNAAIDTSRRETWTFVAAAQIEATVEAWTRIVPAAATVQAALDAIDAEFAKLASQTSNTEGNALVGFEASAGSPHSLSRGTARAAMVQLLGYINSHRNSWAAHQADHLELAGAHGWITAATIELAFQEIVDDLAANSAALTCGTVRVGNAAMPGATGAYDIPADTLRSHLANIWTSFVSAHLAQTSYKHTAAGIQSSAYSWIAATDLQAAVQEIVDDLAAATGATRIGGAAVAGELRNLLSGTLAAQVEVLAGWADGDAIVSGWTLAHAVLLGATLSDGGGLTLAVGAADLVIQGQRVHKDARSLTLPDNATRFIIYDFSAGDYGYIANAADADLGDIFIGHATTSGGVITAFADRRLLSTEVNRRGPIIVGANVPGAHFTRLSDAVAAVGTMVASGEGGIEIVVAGETDEPAVGDPYPKNPLPIVIPHDGMLIRGVPGRGVVRWAQDINLFELNGKDKLSFVDLDIRFDGATDCGVTQNRVVFKETTGTSIDVTFRGVRVSRGANNKPCHGVFWTDQQIHDLKVTDCDFETADFGLRFAADSQVFGLAIRGNTLKRVGTAGNGTDRGAIGINSDGYSVVISDNDITDFFAGIGLAGGADDLRRVRVSGNSVEKIYTAGISVNTVEFGTIVGNVVHDCDLQAGSGTARAVTIEGSKLVVTGNVLRADVSYGGAKDALYLGAGSDGCVVMGNQFCGQGFANIGTNNIVTPTFTDSNTDTVDVAFNGDTV